MSKHSENEKSGAVGKPTTEEDEPIPIPERKNRAGERKLDQNYPQTISQSRENESAEMKLANSTSGRSENKIVLATELSLDDWQTIFRICKLTCGVKMDTEKPKAAFKRLLQFKTCIEYITFHVNDKSSTKAHTRTREMESSFASSTFFDGEIGCSCPYVGIGVSADYLNSEASTNTEKKTYVTYCYNFPRADLHLNTSYLEPTAEFIEAIDSVLSIATLNEQVNRLKEVLSEYGHVYPSSVVLGGHLYHTEEYENKEKAEEARKRIAGDAAFSPSFVKSLKIGAGGAYENRSQEKSCDRAASFTYTAHGGNTLIDQDAGRWADSVAEPRLWRVIEQDEYQSVIQLLDAERQEKIRKIHDHFVSKNPHLSKYFSNRSLCYVDNRT